MIKTRVKTYKYRVGQNNYIVLKIFQTTTARAYMGNVLASNALNVKIFEKRKRR